MTRTVRILSMIVALLSLGLLILPPILFLAGTLELHQAKWLMLVATPAWFISALLWMRERR